MIGTFKLTFNTNFGEKLEINVPRANLNTTESQVRNAMDRIINSRVVLSSKGRPTERLGARLIKTTTTKYTIN